MKKVPDKLMVVAHPDDEILWGGANLLAEPGWHVLVATNVRNKTRSKEFYNTMKHAKVYEYQMFNRKDEYTENPRKSDKLIRGGNFEKTLRKLAKKDWKLVLTHSAEGEYGHEHHKSVHRFVKEIFPSAKFFRVDKKLSTRVLTEKKKLNKWYAGSQAITKMIYNDEVDKIGKKASDYYLREKIYVKK